MDILRAIERGQARITTSASGSRAGSTWALAIDRQDINNYRWIIRLFQDDIFEAQQHAASIDAERDRQRARYNGAPNGHGNGRSNGCGSGSNGYGNGASNGYSNGRSNGYGNGRFNGYGNGRSNGYSGSNGYSNSDGGRGHGGGRHGVNGYGRCYD